MPRIEKTRIARIGVLLLLLRVGVLAADTPTAPVPSQITAAKKAFISNGGQSTGPTDDYTGNQDRCYNQFYAAVKNWGRFELLDAPGDADLVIEVRFANPPASTFVVRGDTVFPYSDPRFTLTIFDSRTHFVLWSLTEHAESARLKGNRDRNYDKAMNALVEDLKALFASPAAAGK